MKHSSYWLDVPYTSRPPLSQDIETEAVILGAGITGVSAAYHSARLGFKTVLIEKETVASGAAGRNGGMVVEGLPIDFNESIDEFGLETTKEMWLRTVESRKYVMSLIQEHKIDCDFEQPGSLYFGYSKEDAEYLKREFEMRAREGIVSEIIEPGKQFKQSPFSATLYNPADCLLHPVKFIRSLAEKAEGFGARIYEHTEVLEFNEHTVRTSKGIIKAKKIVLALESANPYISQYDGEIMCLQGVVTEPLSEEKFESLDWKIGGMFWNMGDDYVSGRRIGNRLFICKGMKLHGDEKERDRNLEVQIGKLLEFFPILERKDLVVSHEWTGMIVKRRNLRPFIGIHNGCYQAFGHKGNGLTNGIIAGKMLADLLTGEQIPKIYN